MDHNQNLSEEPLPTTQSSDEISKKVSTDLEKLNGGVTGDSPLSTSPAEATDLEVELDAAGSVRLPEGYLWDTIDLNDEEQMKEVYNLFKNNYLEDDTEQFALEYSVDLLKWAMEPPDYLTNWILGVREEITKRLVGFLSAIPLDVYIEYMEVMAAQVNFLCVHKELRTVGLAPMLSYELQRRVQLEGVSQLIYTSEKHIARAPEPITNCRSWFRPLNPTKCYDARYAFLPHGSTIEEAAKKKELPTEFKCSFLRKMLPTDGPAVRALLSDYLSKFKLRPIYSEKEFEHLFMSKPFVHVYVVENAGSITDIVSFYDQDFNVLNDTPITRLKCAHSMYTVATSMPAQDLVQDVLILAKNSGYDLFVALEIMDNMDFISGLQFDEMDCSLLYYLHGGECPKMLEKDIGIINI